MKHQPFPKIDSSGDYIWNYVKCKVLILTNILYYISLKHSIHYRYWGINLNKRIRYEKLWKLWHSRLPKISCFTTYKSPNQLSPRLIWTLIFVYVYNTLEYTSILVYSKVLYKYKKIRVHITLEVNWCWRSIYSIATYFRPSCMSKFP